MTLCEREGRYFDGADADGAFHEEDLIAAAFDATYFKLFVYKIL